MRARNIKPGFFKNEDLVEIDPMGRLLFIGLWMMADREGRLEDRPRRIKMEVFPGDNCDVDALLDELQKWGFINRYEVDGSRYIQVLNFQKHQNPNPKEAASRIPAPQNTQENNPDCIQNVSRLDPDCIQNISDTAESLLSESPLLNPESISSSNSSGGSESNGASPSAAEIAKTCRKSGIQCQAQHPLVIELARQKIPIGTLQQACEESRRNGATSIKYVVKVLESWADKARTMNVNGAKPPDGRKKMSLEEAIAARHAAQEKMIVDAPVTEVVCGQIGC